MRAVLLACVLVGASVAGVVGATSATSAATSTEARGPPAGFVGVPDGQIQDLRAAGVETAVSVGDVQGAVHVSAHADTTTVSLVTTAQAREVGAGAAPADVAGERVCSSPAAGQNPTFDCSASFALVVSDDAVDAGREVAIRADVLESALGYVPESLAVQNNATGETWRAAASVQDGYLVADVEHFSSNAVTFSGTVSLSGDPATDGATYAYHIQELDAATEPNVTLTGATQSEWDNETATGVSPSSAQSISLAGTSVTGPSANGEPVLEVTGHDVTTSSYEENNGDEILARNTDDHGEAYIGDTPDTIRSLTVGINYAQSTNLADYEIDVYAIKERPDQTYGEGTLVKGNWDVPTSGEATIQFDSPYSADGQGVTFEFVGVAGNDGSTNQLNVNYDGGNSGTWWTWSGSWSNSNALDLTAHTGAPQSVSVSDDADHSATLGNFADGETKTVEFPASINSTELSWSGSRGALDWTLRAQEHTQTTEARICLNGNCSTPTGALADGEQANQTLASEWITEGENTLDVSVGDGSLSSDAPTPAVGIDYSHGAIDDVNVSYTGETWTERYNITRSWGDAVEDATLTVPFADNVVQIRDVQTRVDGGAWEYVSSDSYTLDGTTLTVQFGDLPSNATTSVRVNGSKVRVTNGTIDVLEPTVDGNDLQTRFEVLESTGAFSVDVSGTASEEWLHYLTNASWTSSEYADVTTDGQTLVLPDVPDGGTATARTLPLKVRPQSDVHVSVSEAGASPVLDVAPGDVAGDSVEYGWFDVVSGSTYGLVSVTASGTARDKAEATDGRVWLTDDEDDAEALEIRVLDSGSSSGGSSDDDSRQVPIISDAGGVVPSVHPVILLGAGSVALLGGAFVVRRTRLQVWTVYPVIGLVGVVVLESLRPGTVTGAVQEIAIQFGGQASDVAPALLLGGGGLALWAVYRLVKKFTSNPRITIKR